MGSLNIRKKNAKISLKELRSLMLAIQRRLQNLVIFIDLSRLRIPLHSNRAHERNRYENGPHQIASQKLRSGTSRKERCECGGTDRSDGSGEGQGKSIERAERGRRGRNIVERELDGG